VKDYVKIFPREGVTNSASGYPESILFKVGMGLTTSPLLLMMYILGEWLGWWLEKTSFTFYKWIIYVANTLAFTGIMGENLTVLSIDPNGTWLEHRYSAYYFYLVVFPYLGLYVWVVSRIRKVYA
jgi:sulfite exporter TauE/SafE